MTKKLFPYSIYQKGKELVKNNQVGTIKRVGNLTHVTVYDQETYHVVIASDKNKQIIGMTCTCIAAQADEKCEHEAAAFIKTYGGYIATDTEEKISSLKQIYDKLASQKNYSQYYLFKHFFEKVNVYLEQFLKNNQNLTLQQCLLELQQMMLDIVNVQIPKQFQSRKVNLFLEAFLKLSIQENFENIFSKWMKKILITPEYFPIHNFLFELFNLFPVRLINPICRQLINQKEIQSQLHLLEYISYYLIIYHPLNMPEELLNIFKQYPESEVYHYLLINSYIIKEDYQKAYEMYQKYTNNRQFNLMEELFYQMEGKLYFGIHDCQKYQEYVYQCYSLTKNRCDPSYLQNLEMLYDEEWSLQKYSIYDHLNQIMDNNSFLDLLYAVDEWQWPFYSLLNDFDLEILYQYKTIMKEYDENLYFFLYQECLIQYITHQKSALEYMPKIYELQEEINDDHIFYQIICRIRKTFENHQIIVSLMDDILKELNKDEIKIY